MQTWILWAVFAAAAVASSVSAGSRSQDGSRKDLAPEGDLMAAESAFGYGHGHYSPVVLTLKQGGRGWGWGGQSGFGGFGHGFGHGGGQGWGWGKGGHKGHKGGLLGVGIGVSFRYGGHRPFRHHNYHHH